MSDVPAPSNLKSCPEFKVRDKTLMGPGPTNCSKRVLRAMAEPVLGHLHPEVLKIMDDIKDGLRYLFQTKNEVTLCISAAGHSGMEACFANLVEPDESVLICTTGIWGDRAGDMARRYGGKVNVLKCSKFGSVLTLDEIESAIKLYQPKVVFITYGDTSTGVLQPVEGVGALCRRMGALLIVDTVAALGGVEFYTDRWECDAVYTGSQKCIGAPAGLAPITFNERCIEKMRSRKSPCPVFYWDILLLGQYWACFPGQPRIYHHTISTTLLYGLREALCEVVDETLERCIERHIDASMYLQKQLSSNGFEFYVERPEERLATVVAIKIPSGTDHPSIAKYAMENFRVEVSGGLGPSVGKIIRIGLMASNATRERVDQYLAGLLAATKHQRSKI